MNIGVVVLFAGMHDSQEPALGSCPICEAPIGERRALVEYETGGSRSTFAECPDCLNIVHPK